MFAILAAICFFLKVIKLDVSVDLIALGLCLLAVHLFVPVAVPFTTRRD